MIHYSNGGANFFLKLCKFKGSVFPVGLIAAAPCSILAGLCKHFANEGHIGQWWSKLIDHPHSILKDNAMWSGFTFLVGFLVVFRTSQAYARFWEGCATAYRMRSVWFSACSALCAFTRSSKQEENRILEFKELLVRMFSILHALAHSEIEDSNTNSGEDVAALTYPVIDPMALDYDVLGVIRDSQTKPELVFQWIQQYIVEQIETGVLNIPPPILSRAFQDLAAGMMTMYEAIKISCNPFPFPYAQTCDCLLLMHWIMTPLVAAARGNSPFMVTLFSFIQVFIMWTLNLIAVELENPFGSDANDLDCEEAQKDMNQSLSMLLQPVANHLPRIPSKDKSHPDERASLAEAWLILEEIQTYHGASTNLKDELKQEREQQQKEAQRVTCRRSARNRKGRQALTLTEDKHGKEATRRSSRRNSDQSGLMIDSPSLNISVKSDLAHVETEFGDKRISVLSSAQQDKSSEKRISVLSDKFDTALSVISVVKEEPIQNNEEEEAAEPTRESSMNVQPISTPLTSRVSSGDAVDPRNADLRTSRPSSPPKSPRGNSACESASERLSRALKAVKEIDCEAPQDSPPMDSPQLKLPTSLESLKAVKPRLSQQSDVLPTPRSSRTDPAMPTPRIDSAMPTPRIDPAMPTPRMDPAMPTPRGSRQVPATDVYEAHSMSPMYGKHSAQSMRSSVERSKHPSMYDAPPDLEPMPKVPLKAPRKEPVKLN